MKWSDFSKLVKLRLTFLVVFSASISFLIGSKVNGEIIEKDSDRLMRRTADRPIPAGRMTTGQGLVLGLFMGICGTYLLGSLNYLTGILSVFSILLYAFAYTPLKRKSPIAVFVGAIP